MNNDEGINMKVNKLFFFVISFFGLIPAIYQTFQGNQTVSQFINNDRKFSTFQLSMTLIATVISIGGVNLILNTSYTNGLNYFLLLVVSATISDTIMIIMMPRLKVFFHTKNFGNAISTLAGHQAMLIISILTCCVSIFLCLGQFKIGLNSAYFLSAEQKAISLWFIGFGIALYIVRGGINAVVKSDIIQLLLGLFGIIIAFLISTSLMKNDAMPISQIMDAVKQDIYNINFGWEQLDIFILFSIPTFSATYISRLFLAKDIKQMQTSFKCSIFSWVILAVTLYLLAKTLNILTATSYSNLNIEIVLKEFSILSPIVKMALLLAWFMFAITTIDSLIHFVTIELINILGLKDEKIIKTFFSILPFLLMLIICFIAQFEAQWQINYVFIYSTMGELMLPVVVPIILFYVIFQKRFNSSLIPILGIVIGCLITGILKYFGVFGSFPSLIGALVNLAILITLRNNSVEEEISYA